MATKSTLKARARRRTPPQQKLPAAIQLRHEQFLERLLRELNMMVEKLLIDQIDTFAAAPKEDGGSPTARALARLDAGRSPTATLNRIFRTWEKRASSAGSVARFKSTASATSTFNKKQVKRQFKSVLQVEVVVADPQVAALVTGFAKDNVKLITRMARKELRKMEKVVTVAQAKGTTSATLAKELQKRLGVTQSRAQLIARDQMNKLNANLTRARHESLGIKQYIWRTSQDDRVREEHEVREGNIYSYSNPPSDGNPGEPVQCRCTADPVINDAVIDRAAA